MAELRRINSGAGSPYDDQYDPRGQQPRMPVPPPAPAPGPAGPAAPPVDLGGVGGSDYGDGAHGGETPRERGSGATPSRPDEPAPAAATPQPPVVASPLPSPGPGSLAKPAALRSLFGGQGGLTGGGLGLPLDPTSNQASDPISTLMQLLKQGGSGGGGGGYF